MAANDAKIFKANCTVCHALSTNRVNSTKTSKKAGLEKWEMNSTDKINKIIYQINNGKLAMAIFKARLKDDDLEGYRA